MSCPAAGIFFLRHQELQETRVERWLVGITGNPGAILGDRNVFRQSLGLNYSKDALKRLPGALLRGWGKFFRRDGGRIRHQRQSLDFVRRAKAVMVKIGERELGADLVGRIVDVRFPVGFGGGEIELLFIFEGAQRIQVRIARLRLDQVGKRGTGLARRPAKRDRAARQRHHAKEDGFERAAGVDVANPRGQFSERGDRPADGGDEDCQRDQAQRAGSMNQGSTSICTSCVPML